MPNAKNRKLNRLKEYNYSEDGWYFITICVKNREHFLGNIENGEMRLSNIGETVRKCWLEIPVHFPDVKLDEFIIMPNHIHGISIIENPTDPVGNNNYCSHQYRNKNFCSLRWQTKWARSLSSVVRGFKIGVKKWCGENDYVLNKNLCSAHFAWQKSYYDHIIRGEKSLDKIRNYIYYNPAKWEIDRNNPENLLM